MYPLLFSALGFIFWSIAIIVFYYSDLFSGVNHIEKSTGWSGYVFLMMLFYGIYKFTTLALGWKKLTFTFSSIVGIVLFHILILSLVYSGLPEVKQSPFLQGIPISGFTLFIHIIQFLLYPLLLVFLTRSAGFTILSKCITHWREKDLRLRFPAEITFGFLIFVIGLLIIGSIGYYTLTGLIIVLIFLSIVGFPGHRESYNDIRERKIEIDNHTDDKGMVSILNLKLLSIEFGFFFLTFLLGVSLISVIRPMPIGWDDLGVYMNFPKIMASTGYLLEGGAMYAWQLITGTGFLFSYTAAQAFYINQLGGILAVIAIISTLSYAFEQKGKIALISLPVLFGALYYAMPMTVFQQAKDMKLDPAYLFFSISSIMLLFHVWKGKEKSMKEDLTLLGLIGVMIGFTFTVKFTSVMLILACLGVIAYRLLSFSGYIGFFFIFLAVFTKLNLWSVMNVPMPQDNPGLLSSISLILGLVGIISLTIGVFSHGRNDESGEKMNSRKNVLKSWILSSIIFGVGVIIGFSPWIMKNIGEIGVNNLGNSSLMSVLGGSGGTTLYPYESLYTQKELEIKKSEKVQGMTKNGKSENEDMGRYFGYEEGLNNYLKLPANLTFQKNQGGEFTDITYIFLALLPSLLLFIKGRRPFTMVAWVGVLLCFMVYYYFIKSTSLIFGNFFGQFTLLIEPNNWKSYGYGFLLLINLGILGFFHFSTENTEVNKKLREIVMFMGIYSFLFIIAAFGIVWYGIVIYFGFFLIMGYSALTFLYASEEDKVGEDKDFRENLHILLAIILFLFIGFYFIKSAFPHGWNNLRSAYYNEYKYNVLTQEESIFVYRSDYLVPIATMNLKDISRIYEGLSDKMQSDEIKNFLANTDLKYLPLDTLHSIIMKYRNTKDIAIRNDVRLLGQQIYSQVLYPPKDNQNTGGIYRIGTFMTYLINENRKRYLEDSLILTFGDYFYDPSPEKTIERMKSLGLKYLLVDLNAATIDRDPRRALTDRAEKLLLTMNASNLRLVSTDNFCLELAIAERKKGKLQTHEEFIDVAGTNFESYRNGITIYRNQKLGNCHRYIISLLNENRSSEYPILEAIKTDIIESNATQDPQKLQAILAKYAGQSWFALFEIIDTPANTPIDNPTDKSLSGSALRE